MFSISRPGSYELHVNPRLSWAAKDASTEGTVAFSQVLPFEVGPADPARLARIMDSLVMKALDRTGSYMSRNMPIEALFSIPESEALPAWDTLIDLSIAQGALQPVQKAIEEMVRVGTPAKADLLAEIVWGRYRSRLNVEAGAVLDESPGGLSLTLNPGPFILAAAHRGLINMYWAGDSELKEHIKALFIEHEGAMREVKGPMLH